MAIAVSTAAMIVVLSVFNGMESFVKELYTGFYPDMKVTVQKGKFFQLTGAQYEAAAAIDGVKGITAVLEDNVIVTNAHSGVQKIARLKGIDNRYIKVNEIAQYITGDVTVSAGNPYTAIGGARLMNELGADINNVFSTVQIWYGNADNTNFIANPESAYRHLEVHPAGLFRISDEFDDKYLLAALPLVQTLFNAGSSISSVEMKVEPGKAEAVKKKLKALFGDGYKVSDRYEQNQAMFMVMKSEGWTIYAILVMVLLIASFNMVGAMSVMVLEKQRDITILRAMGAEPVTLRLIFLTEGVLWSMVGCASGLVLGLLLCGVQMQFGLAKINGSFLMDAYPVELHIADFLLVTGTVLVIGLVASWYPASRAVRAWSTLRSV